MFTNLPASGPKFPGKVIVPPGIKCKVTPSFPSKVDGREARGGNAVSEGIADSGGTNSWLVICGPFRCGLDFPGSPRRCQIVISPTDMTATAIPVQIHLGWARTENDLTEVETSDPFLFLIFLSSVAMASCSAFRSWATDPSRSFLSSVVAS